VEFTTPLKLPEAHYLVGRLSATSFWVNRLHQEILLARAWCVRD
jgi:hypothetical protein